MHFMLQFLFLAYLERLISGNPISDPRSAITKFLPSLCYFRYLALYVCKIWLKSIQ